MANYATPDVGNLTSFFGYANTVTNGWLGYAIVLMTFMIALLSLIRWKMENALLASEFITFVISVLLFAAGLVQLNVVSWLMLIIGGTAIIQWLSS